MMGVLALVALVPEASALGVTLDLVTRFRHYMMHPGGDTQLWTDCWNLPEVIPPCFHSKDHTCLETERTWDCGGGKWVKVKATGETFFGWTMDVQTRRSGTMRTTPATDQRPYTLSLSLKEGPYEWNLHLRRDRSKAWPEILTVNGTMASRDPAFLVRFKDFHIFLGDWEGAEDFVPMKFDGTLRISTEVEGCPQGTFLVRSVGTLRLNVEDLSIWNGTILVNGRAFEYRNGELVSGDSSGETCILPFWPVP